MKSQCFRIHSKKFIIWYYPKSQKQHKGYKKVTWVIKRCVLVGLKKIRKMIGTESKQHSEYKNGGTNLWHSQISLDGTRKWRLLRLLLVVLLAALLISRRKSLLPAVLLAALATSKSFLSHKTRSRRERSCREHLKCYSVCPISIYNDKKRG